MEYWEAIYIILGIIILLGGIVFIVNREIKNKADKKESLQKAWDSVPGIDDGEEPRYIIKMHDFETKTGVVIYPMEISGEIIKIGSRIAMVEDPTITLECLLIKEKENGLGFIYYFRDTGLPLLPGFVKNGSYIYISAFPKIEKDDGYKIRDTILITEENGDKHMILFLEEEISKHIKTISSSTYEYTVIDSNNKYCIVEIPKVLIGRHSMIPGTSIFIRSEKSIEEIMESYEMKTRYGKISQDQIKDYSGDWPKKIDKDMLSEWIKFIEEENDKNLKSWRSVFLPKNQKVISISLGLDRTGKKLSDYFNGNQLKAGDINKIEKYLSTIHID